MACSMMLSGIARNDSLKNRPCQLAPGRPTPGPDNVGMEPRDPRHIIQLLKARANIASDHELARLCGMAQPALHKYLSGKTAEMEMASYRKLAAYFKVTVSQLLGETPLDYDVHTVDPKIAAVVRVMEALPEYKKDVLVAASNSLAEQPTPETSPTAGPSPGSAPNPRSPNNKVA